jgi:hypothetical protein
MLLKTAERPVPDSCASDRAIPALNPRLPDLDLESCALRLSRSVPFRFGKSR